ncbi:MAG: hypothetical protein LBP85_03440 [Prevotellaceae bacterium]|jgi:hypothetical protein|nr:hypothetical protein [Prevotellaceae bacterium]
MKVIINNTVLLLSFHSAMTRCVLFVRHCESEGVSPKQEAIRILHIVLFAVLYSLFFLVCFTSFAMTFLCSGLLRRYAPRNDVLPSSFYSAMTHCILFIRHCESEGVSPKQEAIRTYVYYYSLYSGKKYFTPALVCFVAMLLAMTFCLRHFIP